MKGKILKICRELCEREISEDEELMVSGILDSCKIMRLICSLEEEFNVVFLPDEIEELDRSCSVNDMAEMIRKKQ